MRSVLIALAAALIGVAFVVVTLVHGEETPAPAKAAPARPAPAKPAPAKAAAAEKTLKEITIEGEVRLPEVLFITSRDVERPVDAVGTYLATEDSLTRALDDVPVRVHVTSAAAAPLLPDPLRPTMPASPVPVRETQEEPR